MKKLVAAIAVLGGVLVLGLGLVLVVGNYAKRVDDALTQTNLSNAIVFAFYQEPWQGGAGQLSDDRIGTLASRLDYDKYGVKMPRNPDGFPLDVWGQPFRIHATPAENEAGVYVLKVRSAGADGVFGTDDDSIREERIPIVFYVFRDGSDTAVAYDLVLVAPHIVVQEVDWRKGGQAMFYEYYLAAGQTAEQVERWKVEPGEDVATVNSEKGLLVRITVPADETEPVQETRFPNRTQEYRDFLARLREQCMAKAYRSGGLTPLLVARDARLARFLKASRQATAASSVGPYPSGY